jgi:hypothetical protein
MNNRQPSYEEHLTLCEVLDRVLNKGVLARGEVVISVADIDLIYLNLQLLLSSVESAISSGLLSPTGQIFKHRPLPKEL